MGSPLLLDREFLKTLEQVGLLCQDDLAGGLGADRQSNKRGAGLEFADYRGYRSGEDARALDWNAFLRLGKLFLKVYAAEQNIAVRILLDRSASMDCEGADESKFSYAQRLAATFAYLALLRLDTAVIVPFAERTSRPLVVSGGRNRLWPALEYLNTLTCEGGTALYQSVRQFLESFRSPGMVIVISDLLDEAEYTRAIERLHAAGHDFVFVHVHSAEEQRPSVFGEFVMEDVETGEQRLVDCSPESADQYEQAFLESCERLQRVALRYGGRYARAVTSIPYQDFVLKALRTGRVTA
jgi:uncharacterized protein (DUF58 family)